MHNLDRRQAISGLLCAAGGLVLAGCQSGASGRASRLPGPLWPDQVVPRRPVPTPAPPRAAVTPRPPAGVIARSAWTTHGPVLSLINPMNGIAAITVHHDAINSHGLRSTADAAARLERIRAMHLARGWADIGYHYIIDPAGRVWEGRPVRFQGAHVKDHNEHNLGVMVMGNFDEQRPTPEALATLDAFLADRMRAYRVPLSRIYTHQELMPTACPGYNLQAYMLETRSRSGRLARA